MSAVAKAPAVILASGSRIRAELLSKAGVAFAAEAAAVDESEIKAGMRAEGAGVEAVAQALAELKARKVSNRHPGALVIGSDQILECGGAWFDKPADMDHARAELLVLRGRTHRLVSDTCVVIDGARAWSHGAVAELTMRNFSDRFLDEYLQAMGTRALQTVGAYEVEGLGAQLFTNITGDYFAILGLPLLPLLNFLRNHGAVRP